MIALAVMPKHRQALIEKPWAGNVQIGRELVELCHSFDARCQIEFPIRCMPAMVRLRELMTGNLGKGWMANVNLMMGWCPMPEASLTCGGIGAACVDGGYLLEIWTKNRPARISGRLWLPYTLEWALREAKESTVERFQAPKRFTLMEYNSACILQHRSKGCPCSRNTRRRTDCNSYGHSEAYSYGQSHPKESIVNLSSALKAKVL